jgi:hypothetical protein
MVQYTTDSMGTVIPIIQDYEKQENAIPIQQQQIPQRSISREFSAPVLQIDVFGTGFLRQKAIEMQGKIMHSHHPQGLANHHKESLHGKIMYSKNYQRDNIINNNQANKNSMYSNMKVAKLKIRGILK